MRVRLHSRVRCLARVATIRRLRRLADYRESIILEMERGNRELRRQLADMRLQLEQERGWRYDMPAGKAAARMEALRESGQMDPSGNPFHVENAAILTD